MLKETKKKKNLYELMRMLDLMYFCDHHDNIDFWIENF